MSKTDKKRKQRAKFQKAVLQVIGKSIAVEGNELREALRAGDDARAFALGKSIRSDAYELESGIEAMIREKYSA